MATFLNDTFTGTNGTSLVSHTGETGATWTKHPSSPSGTFVIQNNRVYNATSGTYYYSSGSPATPNYSVTARFFVVTSATSGLGVNARMDTSQVTWYGVRYLTGTGMVLGKLVNSTTETVLSTVAVTLAVSESYDVTIRCTGTTIQGQVQRVSDSFYLQTDGSFASGQAYFASVTDTSITAVGRAGFRGNSAVTNVTGTHVDSISADDIIITATGYSVTGPSSAYVGSPSSNFTLATTPLGGTTSSDVTFTLSDGGAGGTFSPSNSLVVTANTDYFKTFTYTPSSSGAKTITVTNDGGFTNPSPLTLTGVDFSTVAVNNKHIFYSPYNWYLSGSTSVECNNNKGYIKLGFTGSELRITVDVSDLIATVQVSHYPHFKWSVDNGAIQTQQLTNATTEVILAAGLAEGSHRIRIWCYEESNIYDRWNTPVYSWKITGFRISDAGSLIDPFYECAPLAKRALFYGDSITEGKIVDVRAHWPLIVGNAIRAEAGVVGFSSQGWNRQGQGNVPVFPSTWNFHWSGRARSLSPEPDYIFVNQGTNDSLNAISDSTVTNAVSTWLGSIRAICPNSRIFVLIPFGQFKKAAITTGVNNYLSSNLSESKIHIIDLGTDIAHGLDNSGASWLTDDGLHPGDQGSAWLGTMVAQQVQTLLAVTEHSTIFIN